MPVSIVYQVELRDPLLELVKQSDVTAHLSVAVEQLREHFSLESRKVRVEVRHDRHDELEGIGFFDPLTDDLLAHITVFYLEREDSDAVPEEVRDAVRTVRQLKTSLQKLF